VYPCGQMKKPFYLNGIKVRCYGEHVGGTYWELGKRVHHHFWPGLIPLANNTLPIGISFH